MTDSYPPPVRLSQAFENDRGGGGVTRRTFIKRSGGATVGTFLALSIANQAFGEEDDEQSAGSWMIELTSNNPGDGANPATLGPKSKHGWNWKSMVVTVNMSTHLLVVRWKCTPNPKHPTDLVGEKKEAWDFNIEVLAQVRSHPTTSIPPGTEDYMLYEGKYYSQLLADAGYSQGGGGSNGTVTLRETLAPHYLNNGTEIKQCLISHNPVEDNEAFYENSNDKHRLVLGVMSDPANGDKDTSHSVQVSMVAGIIKETLPVSPSNFEISFTPPTAISIKINASSPPDEGTTIKLGEVKTTMGLGFTAIHEE